MLRTLVLFAVASAVVCSVGCSRWAQRPAQSPFMTATPSGSDVIRVINENAAKVQSLYVKDLDISVHQAGQITVPLRAKMALEKPRRFRLIASNALGGSEADLGSNNEEFWCYVRRGEQGPQLIHSSYVDYGRVGRSLPIEPDWIIESIGLTPLPEESIAQPGTKPGTMEIVTPARTPQGQSASKITVVQLRTGTIIERHLETGGRRIASAYLAKHRKDPAFGAVIPGSVTIEWPDTGLKLAMDLDAVQVNPPFNPAWKESLWKLPPELRAGATDIDLGADLPAAPPRRGPTSRRAS